MDTEEYRKRGKEMVDYIADYLENIRERRVFPGVKPGYMRPLIAAQAPEDGEPWSDIFGDVEKVIMPGITHWQSPHMHAYFPALNSYPSLLGDMLADAIGCLGFTWASSPAATELETIVMDWLGKMIGLPAEFLHSNEQTMGGGVIQTTASESTFVALLAARTEAIRNCRTMDPQLEDAEINARLVGYCSEQAHSSVEKAGLIGLVKMRLLSCDDKLSLRGNTLRQAIAEDRENGLIPFYLCATLGTTGACAFDNLKELGPICEEEGVWMHIDAAYAGTAFICPEFRHFLEGVQYAQSFAFNPSKWMMVHFDCTAMWLKNSGALHRTFNVQPLYLRHENTGAAIDYMGVLLAKKFEVLVRADKRFEIPAERHLGMVVFRVKGDNILTETLLKQLNKSGKLHMVPASLKGKYVIRFTVTSQYTTETDIRRDWEIIQSTCNTVLAEEQKEEDIEDEVFEEADEQVIKIGEQVISRVGRRHREGLLHGKRRDYGLSLILSNVPMSPNFINGSFAALFDDMNDVMLEYLKHLQTRSMDSNSHSICLSPRRKLRDQGKQFSLDLALPIRSTPLRRDLAPKQGSLDSKLEEIFDTSFESESLDDSAADEDTRVLVEGMAKDGIRIPANSHPGTAYRAGAVINGATLYSNGHGHHTED